MKKVIWLFLAVPVILLVGCASPARSSRMTYSPTSSLSYNSYFKNAVGIEKISGDYKNNPSWRAKISNEAFFDAVKRSLEAEGLFSDSGRYKLHITMQIADVPMMGIDLTSTISVNYILMDNINNYAVLNKSIGTTYTATLSQSPIAIYRLRMANELAAQLNIKGLLENVSEL